MNMFVFVFVLEFKTNRSNNINVTINRFSRLDKKWR